jgi:hypothetical protein
MSDHSTSTASTDNSRQLADFLAIMLGMSLLGVALYGAPLITSGEGTEIRYGAVVWLVCFLTGTVALIATGMAQWERYQTIARVVLALNGVVLLGGLFAFNNFGPRALGTLALPGVAFIVLSRFLGPIPPRRAVGESR